MNTRLTAVAGKLKLTVGTMLSSATLEGFPREIRYAAAPGFVAATACSLGIGTGANAAIFTVADALMWRSLPCAIRPPRRRFRLRLLHN